jgi:mono/diheme cytochrome c family protein
MWQKLYHWVMRIRSSVFAAAGLMFLGTLAVSARQEPQPKANPNGWSLPANADEEKNPFAGDEKAVAAGKALYEKTCKKCHGPGGKGDGPDADPDSMQDMDLTNPKRATRNADGIVFYKIWNGRKKPKMPAQKDELTKDQVWQIVSFAQTLRQKP